MSERDLDARLDAVERALTDGDTDLTDLREASGVVDDVQSLEDRLETVESRLDDLEAGLEAVRGYAGNVRAVNREVERRASAALAKAETVEAAVDGDAAGADGRTDRPRDRAESSGPVEPSGSAEPTESVGRSDTASSPSDSPARRAPARSSSEGPHAGADPDRDRASGSGRDRGRRPNAGGVDDDRRRASVDDGRRERSVPDDSTGPDRSTRDPDRRHDGASTAAESGSRSSSDEGADSQTEQFIERVRDAL